MSAQHSSSSGGGSSSEAAASSAPSSRPSTSHSCQPYHRQGGGVLLSPSLTNQKLGFFSPSYDSHQGRHTACHGMVGGVGYTSSMHSVLAPALQQHPCRAGPGPARVWHRVHSSPVRRPPASSRRRLSPQDLEYLRQNEERNRQVFQAWRQAKEGELAAKAAQEERQRQQDLHLFLHKEVQMREACEARVREWEQRKAAQASMEAAQRAFYRQQGRQLAVGTKTRSVVVQTANQEREERFLLQTDPHVLPTRLGFHTTLG